MKKMTKVLALLTVMAMLATLFVAAPASASLAELQGMTPTWSIEFTSDLEGTTEVDPNALAVGDTFYAWMTISNVTPGVYVDIVSGFITWDEDVVTPTESGDEYEIAPSLVVNPDLEDLTFATQGKGTKLTATGRYDVQVYSNDSEVATNQISNTNIFGYVYMPTTSGYSSKSEDEFYQMDATGKLRIWGYAFEKTATGNVGVTAAKPNATLNGKAVAYNAGAEGMDIFAIEVCDNPVTIIEAEGAAKVPYQFHQGIDNTPVDGAATEAPTDEPTAVPTDVPTEAPTDVPEAQGEVSGAKEASNSEKAPNAFFYQFTTPVIPGDVTGLTATFQIDGKDAVNGDVTNINLTGISNTALKIVAIVKNIPEEMAATPVTTTYTLNYSVAGVPKTLVWSRSNSLK